MAGLLVEVDGLPRYQWGAQTLQGCGSGRLRDVILLVSKWVLLAAFIGNDRLVITAHHVAGNTASIILQMPM